MAEDDPTPVPPTASFGETPREVRDAANDPGRRFGKYVLLEQVGVGGIGQVYRAWDTALNRVVAIKVLKTETSIDDAKRFFREAQTTASLTHPNIAPVYDVGEQSGHAYIAMQFIDGCTLADLRMVPRSAAGHIRSAALALQAAHRAGIVHRDVKPGNIMLDKGGRLYVMDFGIAKPIRGRSDITQEGITVGTPSYMSPEQARGLPLTAKSDIYSLGATLYELVVHKPPYEAGNPVETLMKILNEDPPPPSAIRRDVPHDLELVILKCMEREPLARYADAQAAADDLERFLNGEPVHAQPPSLSTQVRRIFRKKRATIAGAAVATVIAAFVLAFLVWSSQQAGLLQAALAAADAKYDARRYEEALALYNQALALDRSNRHVRERIADCGRRVETTAAAVREAEARQKRLAAAQPEVDRGRERLEQAERDLYRRGADLAAAREKAGEAAACFDRALAACPDHVDALTLRGRSRLLRLDSSGAEADFSKAIAASPRHAPALVSRGRLHIRRYVELFLDAGGAPHLAGPPGKRAQESRERALVDFAAAAKAGQAERQDAFDAMVLFADGRYGDCVAACDRAIARNATDEEMHKLRGDARFFGAGVDQYRRVAAPSVLREAFEDYSRAIELRCNYPDALMMRGTVLLNLGEPAEAKADLDAAVAIDGRDFMALTLCAKVHVDGPRANDLLTRALEVRPDAYQARVNRAALLGGQQRFDEALADLDRALQVNPDHMWAWQLKGAVLGHVDRVEDADAVLTKAISMAPDFATIWYNRGAIRLRMQGRRADGIADLEEAVRLNHPNSAAIREMIRKLREQ